MKSLVTFCLATLLLVALAAAPSRADDATFSKQQLDQMLAPIALYPDELLSNVLMASTYPLDVVEAQRWRREGANAKLQGDALADAIQSKSWDPSIKALVQFPDVLKMMSDQLDWTQKLGEAFVNQQAEVMDEVQLLRSKADDSGHLKSNSKQTVKREDGDYIIEPAEPNTVYVPVYEPSVYGSWWYPDYQPYYWNYPGAVFSDGYFWGAAGVIVAGSIWGWNRWNWHKHDIHIDSGKWNRINRNHNRIVSDRWQHDVHHRGAIRPHDKKGDIERRRQMSKEFRKPGTKGAQMIKPGTNGAALDTPRRRNQQFHSPKRKAALHGGGGNRQIRQQFHAPKAAHVRNFRAPKFHSGGGRRLRRR